MSTGRRWCFTLNNYTQAELDSILAWTDHRYLIVGREGEASDAVPAPTPHLQGFVIWNASRRFSALKRLQDRCHWELARGSTLSNFDYCSKEGNFQELGDRPEESGQKGGEAEKERWASAKRSALSGDLDSVPPDIYLRFYRTLKEIKKDHMAPAPDALGVTGQWFWGAPGTGKSRDARALYPGAYLKMQNKWWDGYQGEEAVILDDFDCKELGHHLKIWGDRYAFIAENKGGALQIRPKFLIITSNYTIEQLFDQDKEMCAAIKRRFPMTQYPKP